MECVEMVLNWFVITFQKYIIQLIYGQKSENCLHLDVSGTKGWF